MKYQWLHKQQKKDILIFCNGWGMDAEPVKHLAGESYDVLMFYNYSHLECELDLTAAVAGYDTVSLVAWSMGVWAGQQLFSTFNRSLLHSVALNGTLCPIDDQYGIPQETVCATLEHFNDKQRKKFYYRMCRDRELYAHFLTIQPQRSVADQKEELASLLKNAECRAYEKPVYTRAVVAKHDFIIPTQNQLQFWPENMVRRVDGSHFLFYAYRSWDELLEKAEA